ncbi:MAG: cation:dicarboxylate symporter family transporter [Planctomycetota bacterium]|jgi:Na+/H+-dicarboxylate symporter
MVESEERSGRKHRIGLAGWIVIGLVAGIACGIVFGEYCAVLNVVGGAFIQLLQMAILPYILISLMARIGSLDYGHARKVAARGGLVMLLLWALALCVVVLLPFSFPRWETASFFSTSILHPPQKVDYLSLYIPSNPFQAMANTVIPAVVLFSIAVGIALITIRDKEKLIGSLSVLSDALTRVAMFVVKLTPIGVFAIAASSAGTMTLEELGRLQVYLIAIVVGALFLCFLVLPGLIAACTPFGYREVLRTSRTALVTAFATGNVFVVLPVLIEDCKKLYRERGLDSEEAKSSIEILIPVGFNFPNVGRLLLLLFVLFAAWYSGNTVSASKYPGFLVSGLISLFGNAAIAIPYLLDALEVPADYFQLFILTALFTSRFTHLLAAMSLLALAVITTAAMTGSFTWRWRRLLPFFAGSGGLLVVLVVGLRVLLQNTVDNEYTKDRILAGMQLIDKSLQATVHREPPSALTEEGDILDRVRERGVLRAGYESGRLPLSFFNRSGDLVGFDVEMAHRLARDMGVRLEFVPANRQDLAAELDRGLFDIAMVSVPKTPQLAEQLALTHTSMEFTLCFIAPDHERRRFSTMEALGKGEGLRIGIPKVGFFGRRLREAFSQAEFVELDSLEEFFAGDEDELDAFVTAAEVGSAWTLLYPSYSVVVPQPVVVKIPIAYSVARGHDRWRDYIDSWLQLHMATPAYQRAYDRWIYGKDAVPKKPRWSVLRALGW